MRGVDIERGVTAASAAAGPVFTLTLLAPIWSEQAGLSAVELGSLLVVLVYALIGGIMFSVLPNAIGAAVLAALGRSVPWTRFPAIWGGVGLGLG